MNIDGIRANIRQLQDELKAEMIYQNEKGSLERNYSKADSIKRQINNLRDMISPSPRIRFDPNWRKN